MAEKPAGGLHGAERFAAADADYANRGAHYTGRSPFTVTRVPERVCGQ